MERKQYSLVVEAVGKNDFRNSFVERDIKLGWVFAAPYKLNSKTLDPE